MKYRVYQKVENTLQPVCDYKKMSEAISYIEWMKRYDEIIREKDKSHQIKEFEIREVELNDTIK